MFGFGHRESYVRSQDRGERARYAVALNNHLIKRVVAGALQFKSEGFGPMPAKYLSGISEYQSNWKKDRKYFSNSQYELYSKFNDDIDSIRRQLEFTLWDVRPEIRAQHINNCYGKIAEIIEDMILIRNALGA